MGIKESLSRLQPALLSHQPSDQSMREPLYSQVPGNEHELMMMDGFGKSHSSRPLPPYSKYYKGERYKLAAPERSIRNHEDGLGSYDLIQEKQGAPSDKLFDLPAVSKTRWRWFVSSWRFSISCWTALCVTVLLINVSLTVAAGAKKGFEQGLGTLYHGDCKLTQRYNTAVHICINILSTCLLAGSNFCMQCLSAPTRQEIDQAHAKRVALDVGIPNIRNLGYMRKRKWVTWILLGASSLPLHLFYNSVVYASIAYNDYNVIFAAQDFLKPGFDASEFKSNSTISANNNSTTRSDFGDLQRDVVANKLQRLEPADCIREYGQSYVTSGNVVVIMPSKNDKIPAVEHESVITDWHMSGSGAAAQLDWLCPEPPPSAYWDDPWPSDPKWKTPCRARLSGFISDPSTWQPLSRQADYCLVQDSVQECSLVFSLPIALIIISLNCVKAILMLTAAFGMDSNPILTIGDAFQSFINRPDQYTKGRCLYEAWRFQMQIDQARWGHTYGYTTELIESVRANKPLVFEDRRRRLWRSPGTWRWLQVAVPWVGAIASVIALFGWGMTQIPSVSGLSDALSLGLGSVNSDTIMVTSLATHGTSALLGNVIMANSPQIVLSIIYFAFNALFTTMLTGLEWTQLPLKKKGLRVSAQPRGDQRSTYFLQLPYRYSIPLMVASGGLHWLISQAIYLIALDRRVLDLRSNRIAATGDASDTIYSCGWSPLAVLLVIILGTVLMLGTLAIGYRKFPTGMPAGTNNSFVLAAACHPNKELEGEGLEYKKLKWGAVENAAGERPGHCSLTTLDAEYPVKGEKYA